MGAGAWEYWLQRGHRRYFLSRLRARVSRPPYKRLPPLVVNGLPKGGTHLLARCVVVLGGIQRFDFFLHRKTASELNLSPVSKEGDGVPLGIGEPTLILRTGVERALASLWVGEFALGHIPHSPEFEDLLKRHGLRMLLILRDPRDVAVSLVHHIVSSPENRLHEYFTRVLRTPEERLLAAITGVERGKAEGAEWSASIGDQVRSVLPWLSASLACVTRFERLVGSEGGGSQEAQQTEIERIARHVGLSLTPDQTQSVASQLFGQGSPTFRRGQIGSWKEAFHDEHKAACKRAAGRELIELGYERDLNW